MSVADLLDAGLLTPGAVLINRADDVEATVTADGRVEFSLTVRIVSSEKPS